MNHNEIYHVLIQQSSLYIAISRDIKQGQPFMDRWKTTLMLADN